MEAGSARVGFSWFRPIIDRSHLAASGLTLTSGVNESCRGASDMDIRSDVTGLLSAVWKVTLKSICLGCRSWPGRRVSYTRSTYMHDIKESIRSRQLDRWRWPIAATTVWGYASLVGLLGLWILELLGVVCIHLNKRIQLCCFKLKYKIYWI